MTAAGSAAPDRRIDINMTPMIDVVFQLLTFFLMTFRVASAEGDFLLKLPPNRPTAAVVGRAPQEIHVRAVTDSDGALRSITVDWQHQFTGPASFDLLRDVVARFISVAHEFGQEEPTVVLDVDDGLRYEQLMCIVAAVSQHVDEAGNVAPLAKKIKFAPR